MPVALDRFKRAFGASVSKDMVGARDGKVDAALKTLKDEAAALQKLGFDTAQMEDEYAGLVKAQGAAAKLKDNNARYKALEGIKKEANEAVEHSESLSKATKDIMGKSKANPSDVQKSSIYKKALEDLYKLKITVPPGMDNTHLDRVFDMFGSVPKKHVVQDKLKTLVYTAADDDKGSGAYTKSTGEVEMGDFGTAAGKEDYVIDGVTIPANSFNVTTLHEIGHAVDAKNSVMNNNMSKVGCGGWKVETPASITTALVTELKTAAGLSKALKDADLTAAVATVLQSGAMTKPTTITDEDWKIIEPFLKDTCLPIRSASKPWFNPPPGVGGRVYAQAYSSSWYSYTESARAATKVNDYQWRAPGEWFAEVYAISWLSKKPPPAGVDAAAAAYMWKAKA